MIIFIEEVMLIKKMFPLAYRSFIGSNSSKQKYCHTYDTFIRISEHNKKGSLT